jgi:hypothetical protein
VYTHLPAILQYLKKKKKTGFDVYNHGSQKYGWQLLDFLDFLERTRDNRRFLDFGFASKNLL